MLAACFFMRITNQGLQKRQKAIAGLVSEQWTYKDTAHSRKILKLEILCSTEVLMYKIVLYNVIIWLIAFGQICQYIDIRGMYIGHQNYSIFLSASVCVQICVWYLIRERVCVNIQMYDMV